MIKILLIDDDSRKLSKLRAVINGFDEISDADVETCLDLVQARKNLESSHFDLMILDLNLPNRLGEEAKPYIGVQFLQELNLSLRLNKPSHIIGFSSHPNLIAQYQTQFTNGLWSLIHFDEQSRTWEEQLKNKIRYLINEKKQPTSHQNSYNNDIAIITAVPTEFRAVKELNCKWVETKIPNDPTSYYSGFIQNESKQLRVVAACTPQMGMIASTFLSTKLIYNFHPKYLAMVGIAAGVKGKGNFGDILIAEQTWDFSSGKNIFDEDTQTDTFKPDFRPYQLDSSVKEKVVHDHLDILSEIQNKWTGSDIETKLQKHIGPVASSSLVLENQKVIDGILTHNRKLVGIDMETYGVFYAANNCPDPRPSPLSIKSICDFGDSHKNDNYQRYAAYTSANYLYHFALREL